LFPEKIKITDELIKLIIDTRKKYNLTSYQLSEKIGKNKSWLPNIENKRTKNISKSDLYLLFQDFADKENLRPEQYIVKYLPRNCMIELENNIIAPCYHVREMLGIYDSWEEYESLSPDVINDEADYHLHGRSDSLREKDISASLYRLSNVISDKLKLYNLEKKEDIIRYIDTMTDNFQNDFEHTLDLYGKHYCPDDPLSQSSNARLDYISSLDKLIAANNVAVHMMASRAFVYSFIEVAPYDSYQFFKNIKEWNNLNDSEEDKLFFALDDIKNYHFCVYSYIEYFTEYSSIFRSDLTLDYDLIFSKLYEAFRSYIKIAKLNYFFDLPIPNGNSDISDLHQKTNKIIFDIEKEMRCRYSGNDSIWSF
jgi:transcriptional regulator with XRE-family HTH domain